MGFVTPFATLGLSHDGIVLDCQAAGCDTSEKSVAAKGCFSIRPGPDVHRVGDAIPVFRGRSSRVRPRDNEGTLTRARLNGLDALDLCQRLR